MADWQRGVRKKLLCNKAIIEVEHRHLLGNKLPLPSQSRGIGTCFMIPPEPATAIGLSFHEAVFK